VIERGVPGDLIETGVWRGGITIFMHAALEAYGDETRCVWVADSFRGLPEPDEVSYPADRPSWLSKSEKLAVLVDEVKENFRRYGLFDERIHFLVGWFRDTLPPAPIDRLASLRLDGDMYESTRAFRSTRAARGNSPKCRLAARAMVFSLRPTAR
jgi:O-methyltransferase